MVREQETALLVEDNPTLSNLYSRYLSIFNYSIVTAYFLSEALNRLEENDFSLIVSDIEFPRRRGQERSGIFSGLALLHSISKNYPLLLPVTFLISAGNRQQLVEKIEDLKIPNFNVNERFYTKPLVRGDFESIIKVARLRDKN